MNRPLGLVADYAADVKDDLLNRPVGALLGASVTAPPAHDLSPALKEIPDQEGTSACGGEAMATAVEVRAETAGSPIERPSEKAIYDFGRYVDSPGVLLDVGSRFRALIEGMQEHGLVARSRWPLTEANVNEPPPFDIFVEAIIARLGGWYRIGHTRPSDEIVQAIAKGFPVPFGMYVDTSYMRLGWGDTYREPTGESRGGHAQCFTGYETMPNGRKRFKVAGSWGRTFATDGYAWLDEDCVNSALVFDVMVITVVPTRVT